MLQFLWNRYLRPIASHTRSERERELHKIFASSFLIDAYLVSYFRSLNHQCLALHRAEFDDYADVDTELSRILTYGQESEGIELLSMAKVLNATIVVMAVLHGSIQELVYEGGDRYHFLLFFRPGHY